MSQFSNGIQTSAGGYIWHFEITHSLTHSLTWTPVHIQGRSLVVQYHLRPQCGLQSDAVRVFACLLHGQKKKQISYLWG